MVITSSIDACATASDGFSFYAPSMAVREKTEWDEALTNISNRPYGGTFEDMANIITTFVIKKMMGQFPTKLTFRSEQEWTPNQIINHNYNVERGKWFLHTLRTQAGYKKEYRSFSYIDLTPEQIQTMYNRYIVLYTQDTPPPWAQTGAPFAIWKMHHDIATWSVQQDASEQ